MTGDNSILFSLLGPGSSNKTGDLPLTDAATIVPGEETIPNFADVMQEDFGTGPEDPTKKLWAEDLSDGQDVDEWVAQEQRLGIGDQKPVVVVEEGLVVASGTARASFGIVTASSSVPVVFVVSHLGHGLALRVRRQIFFFVAGDNIPITSVAAP